MIAWLKRHHIIHSWMAWGKPTFVIYNMYYSDVATKIGERLRHVQDRYCERCGVRERRFLE